MNAMTGQEFATKKPGTTDPLITWASEQVDAAIPTAEMARIREIIECGGDILLVCLLFEMGKTQAAGYLFRSCIGGRRAWGVLMIIGHGATGERGKLLCEIAWEAMRYATSDSQLNTEGTRQETQRVAELAGKVLVTMNATLENKDHVQLARKGAKLIPDDTLYATWASTAERRATLLWMATTTDNENQKRKM